MDQIKICLSNDINLSNPIHDDYFECFLLNDGRYLILLDQYINHDNVQDVLNKISDFSKKHNLNEWKSFIIIAWTSEIFEKKELFYFDNVNTFVTLFLINSNNDQIYSNSQWIFAIGVGFRKYVKKIETILMHKHP